MLQKGYMEQPESDDRAEEMASKGWGTNAVADL